jgi:hypothetical protein
MLVTWLTSRCFCVSQVLSCLAELADQLWYDFPVERVSVIRCL